MHNLGTLTLTNSTVSGNSARLNGGGVDNFGTLTLTNSTVSGNSVGFSFGRGGGVHNTEGGVTLTNSTISGNSAGVSGGGVYNSGTLTLTNSTVSGNSARYGGGGVFNLGSHDTLTLTNSTVSGNNAGRGGGVYNYFGGLTLARTLVSGNTATSSPEIINYFGVVTANNFNLFGHDGDAGVAGFSPGPTDIVPSEPLSAILDPLADNGGPTLTHALLAGSPAVDMSPVDSDCPPTDQRGVSRPQGAACDIGAFEQGTPDLGLTVSGSCPGQVTVAISGASPGGSVALVRGSGPGSFTVPGGPCQGLVLGLEDVQLVTVRTADPNGELQGSASVPGGLPLQAADLATCTASNVASIP